MTIFSPNLVNVVGGGDLNQRLHLEELHKEIEGDEVRYDPEQWAGLYICFEKNSPAILVFSSGKFNIAGAESVDELLESKEKFLSKLSELDYNIDDTSFEVRNQVFIDEYESEFDLDALAIDLGMENTEYNPELFPAIFYNLHSQAGTFEIFRTGSIVLTGVKSKEQAESAFKLLGDEISMLISNR